MFFGPRLLNQVPTLHPRYLLNNILLAAVYNAYKEQMRKQLQDFPAKTLSRLVGSGEGRHVEVAYIRGLHLW